MEIALVIGSVVATAKTPGLAGFPLMLVQPTDGSGEPHDAQPYVAIDRVGAGAGEVVLVTRYGAARIAAGKDIEIDAAIVAIVDAIDVADAALYRKS
jgi:ethanolamine utilization protein EutN